MIGDVLLIPRDAKGAFLAGLVSFLLGHVAYTGAFALRGLDPIATAIGALPVAAVEPARAPLPLAARAGERAEAAVARARVHGR